MSNETVHHAPGNDASQDPAQPPVGPAIQFEKLVVPDDDPSVEVPTGPPGELIDQRRAELEAEANGK